MTKVSLSPGAGNEASAAQKASIRRSLVAVTFTSGAPSDAFGNDGELCVDEDSGVLYKKAAGSWSAAFTPSGNEISFVTALPDNGTGANGDLAIIYSDGVISGLAEKSGGSWSQVATNAVTSPKPTDLGVISVVDNFLGGTTNVSPAGFVGELNWRLDSTVGTGAARGDATAGEATLGVLQIITGATSGNGAAISFDNGTAGGNTFLVGALTSMEDLTMRWRFKCDTAGTFYLGLSNNPASAADPTRFVGIRATNGTTNFQFEATNGTPATEDSGVAVDTAWHDFALTYDQDTAEWIMQLDDETPVRLARTLVTSLTVTIAAWAKTNSAATATLYLDTFQLFGRRT